MQCRNCPYGKEDFESKMYQYQKTINEKGIPNDIYRYLKPEDAADEFEQFLWCDKVGGKVYRLGHCTDFYESNDEISIVNHCKKKRKNKRERDLKYKRRLKYLATYCNWHPSPAVYIDEIFIRGQGWVKSPKPYYKRIYRSKRSEYFKKCSNKAIRRYKGELHNGWMCHKIFDFWWQYD